MSEFDFKLIVHELPDQLLRKSFLWIWNADKVPPHIGVSVEKEYFSLTYRKSEHLLTVSMLKKAKRSAIPLVLVEIPGEVFKADPASVFGRYERAVGEITCLQPLREVMQLDSGVNQLADLLNRLQSKNLIKGVNGLNLPQGYKGIPDYSMAEILERISQLNQLNA